MTARTKLLIRAAIHAALFVYLTVVARQTAGNALLVVAIMFAVTSMLTGWPRMPPRRRNRAGRPSP